MAESGGMYKEEKPVKDSKKAKGIDEDELTGSQKVGYALMGLLPAVLGYSVGGAEGGAIGAQAGLTGMSAMGKEQEAKRASLEKKRVSEKEAAELKLKQAAEARQEKRLDEEMNLKRQELHMKRGEDSFKRLPKENQEQIEGLAKKNASKASIATQIDATVSILDDPKVSEAIKVQEGRRLLKVLNSSEGADAVGAEEAKRLGGLLEYKLVNFFQPGSFIGRDVNMFADQSRQASQSIKSAMQTNQGMISQLKTGQSLVIPPTPQRPAAPLVNGGAAANAAEGPDPVVKAYSRMHGLSYEAAKQALIKQEYEPKE